MLCDRNKRKNLRLKDFINAVDDYISAIRSEFSDCSRDCGDRYHMEKKKRKIIDLFRQAPEECRFELKYRLLKMMTQMAHGNTRFNGWLVKLAHELDGQLQ